MKHILAFLLIIIVFSTSCKKVLNQDPVSTITLDKAFENESDVRAAVVGVYNQLALETDAQANEMPLRYMYDGEYRSDSYMSRLAAYKTASQGNFDNTWPWANWQNYYASLRGVNNLLYYSKNISDDKFSSTKEKNRLLGEGYFLRAFIFWNLVRTWENIVLRTEPTLNTNGDFYGKQVPPAEVLSRLKLICCGQTSFCLLIIHNLIAAVLRGERLRLCWQNTTFISVRPTHKHG